MVTRMVKQMKYHKGDRVRVLGPSASNIGRLATVVGFGRGEDRENLVRICLDGNSQHSVHAYHYRFLELIDRPPTGEEL